MKPALSPASTLFALVALLTGVLVLSGCSSTPKVDWDSRVGSFTFDQAVTELGPPERSTQLSDSSTVAEWMVGRSGPRTSIGFGVGGGSYGGGFGTSTGVGVSTPVGSRRNTLRLVFGPDKVLKSWTRL